MLESSESFTRRFRLSLLGLAIMTAGCFVAQTHAISPTSGDAAAVNVAGRQRMLSQRVALQTAVLADTSLSQQERRRAEGKLEADLTEMAHALEGLTQGDPDMGLDGELSPALRTHYFGEPGHLSGRTQDFLDRARTVLDRSRATQTVTNSDRVHVVVGAEQLLPPLDEAVTLFEGQASNNVESAVRTTAVLTLSMMVALFALWLWIFRPLGQALREEEARRAAVSDRKAAEERQQGFAREVSSALEVVDSEEELLSLLERAMADSEPHPTELLLADSSQAHMHRVAVHPEAGAPGCSVSTPHACPAVRRGRPLSFESSQRLDACPRLNARGPCSAFCAPVTFMGRALGVLHATGPEGQPPSPAFAQRTEFLAGAMGARLGSIRSLERIQLQAATDPLTGLLNRRALETEVRKVQRRSGVYAVAIADLDHFKRLNDTLGHDAGDRALTTYAKCVQEVVGDQGFVSRFGGEEFVLVFPDHQMEAAARILEQARERLATITAGGDTPCFTASYGVADSRHADDLAGIISVADAALLRAKEAGRDRVLLADAQSVELHAA